MTSLIIADIHDSVDKAQTIIDKVRHDRLVFLGDFFDNFRTGVKDAKKTARKVKEWLSYADVTMGNHDLSYGWGWACRPHICAGYTPAKKDAIHAELTWEDWCKFKLHLWIPGPRRPWLITHAGFDRYFVPEGESDLISVVDSRCEAALASLHGPNPYERGRGHSILGAGVDRRGPQYKGGVLWCDWHSFDAAPGADQLVGHTPGLEPRVSEHEDAIAVCIDTSLRHYAVLDDGILRVEEFDRLPISG